MNRLKMGVGILAAFGHLTLYSLHLWPLLFSHLIILYIAIRCLAASKRELFVCFVLTRPARIGHIIEETDEGAVFLFYTREPKKKKTRRPST